MNKQQNLNEPTGPVSALTGQLGNGRACQGAETISTMMGLEHAQECHYCGMKVRDDLVDHPFFGFESGCSHGA